MLDNEQLVIILRIGNEVIDNLAIIELQNKIERFLDVGDAIKIWICYISLMILGLNFGD